MTMERDSFLYSTLLFCLAVAELKATLHDDDESNVSIMQNCIQSDILAVIKSRSLERTAFPFV